MDFRVEHVIRRIDLPTYERLYFDEAFNEALCKAVKLDRVLEAYEEKEGRLHRAVRVGPDRELPAPAAKILGASRIEYTEHVEYTFGAYRATWKTISSLLTDKVDSHGRFGFDAHPEGVLRWVEGTVKVKLFGVGGMIERVIVGDVERSYQQAADFTQQWIDSGRVSAAG